MIRYYSATRPVTVWTRGLDWAMLAAFLLAVPMTWVCDAMVARSNIAISLSGQLFKQSDDSFAAILLNVDKTISAHAPGTPVGIFQLTVIDRLQGFPLITTTRRMAASIDIELRTDPQPRPNAKLSADDPLRLAIAAALKSAEENDALEAWDVDGSSSVFTHRSALAWFFGAGLWWIILNFIAFITVSVLKFISHFANAQSRARRAQLRSEGKCISCGYDMTGLEFNERCPECGELVW
jgi:hypothetical protein